jgi:glycosyltransferase involved in cell wall biosynthesis
MISVLILTRNEELNLPGCIASVDWSDDIHVFDSFSTDSTVEIARDLGATVTQRRFDNWSSHQNWGLRNIPFKHPWIFYLDADERASVDLKSNMLQAVCTPGDVVAFRVRRRDFFQGTWLRHSQASPYYQRLFKPERMRYERLVNPVSLIDGPVAQIGGFLDHFPFSKGLAHWIERHNQYSFLEAKQIVENRKGKANVNLFKALFSRDFHERRYHQKEIFYHVPARPIAKFLLLYFLRRGFLDGRAGLRYCLLQSIYEYMIVLKTLELEDGQSGFPKGRKSK